MSTDPAELASAELVSGALTDHEGAAYFVGGFVRDWLLGVSSEDVDIVVAGDPKAAARKLHRALGGDIFSLSDRFGTWRVLTGRGFQVDVTELRAESIERDLAERDFTINAIALKISGGEPIDPFDGQADLSAKTLRMVSEQALVDDPLRLLRLARLAAGLGFVVEPATLEAARRHATLAGEPAAERTYAELRALVGSDDPLTGIRLLDDLGLLAAVLPELYALKGMEQTVYHHKDVFEHTLEVLENFVALERDGFEVFEEHAPALRDLLKEELADGLTRGGALRWAALLHDIGKAETLTRFEDGRIGFPGHDRRGAEMVRDLCRRLHTSERFAQYIAALTRHHMRLGYLIPDRPLAPRAEYEYLSECDPVEVEVGVLSVADRMATRGRKHEEGIPRHVGFAVELTDKALDWRAKQPEPLIRGDQLAAALGIEPGPRLGELLAELAAAQYAGEVSSAEEAIALARASL